MLKVRSELDNEILKIYIDGRIDSNSFQQFAEQIKKPVEAGGYRKIVFDFADLDYVSSAGLRVFLGLRRNTPKDIAIEAVNINETVRDVFELTGFDDVVSIDPDVVLESKTKVIFFDIDGTLFSHKTQSIPQSAIDAISEVRKNGVLTVVCTGRDIRELRKLPVYQIPFDGYLTLNGNVCLDEHEKMFAGIEIDQDEVEILVRIFSADKIPFVLVGKDKRYINHVDDLVIDTQTSTNGTIPDIGEYRGEKIYQCLAFVQNKERLMLDDLLDDCIITSWNDTGIDIISKHGGKAAGIQKFMDHYGFRLNETMAFGDGQNDIDMIRFVGTGISMGNGIDALKKAADYVTTDIDDDGIANGLRHFGLIQ